MTDIFSLPDAITGRAQSGHAQPTSLVGEKTRMPRSEVPDRDARVIFCVKKLRMTARNIFDYSQCWPYPFHNIQDLDDRIGALKLRRKIKWQSQQSKHEQCVLAAFIKIARDAKRKGLEVWDVEKEYSIPGAGIRADVKFKIGDRVFFLEFEISDRADGYTRKMRKYIRYRKSKGVRPFRVLFVFDNKGPLTRVFYNARTIMKAYPNLSIFLFGWSPDTPMGSFDSVCQPVWTDTMTKTVPLMEAQREELR